MDPVPLLGRTVDLAGIAGDPFTAFAKKTNEEEKTAR